MVIKSHHSAGLEVVFAKDKNHRVTTDSDTGDGCAFGTHQPPAAFAGISVGYQFALSPRLL